MLINQQILFWVCYKWFIWLARWWFLKECKVHAKGVGGGGDCSVFSSIVSFILRLPPLFML